MMPLSLYSLYMVTLGVLGFLWHVPIGRPIGLTIGLH